MPLLDSHTNSFRSFKGRNKDILVRVVPAGWRQLRDLAAELTLSAGDQVTMQGLITQAINETWRSTGVRLWRNCPMYPASWSLRAEMQRTLLRERLLPNVRTKVSFLNTDAKTHFGYLDGGGDDGSGSFHFDIATLCTDGPRA